MGIIYRILDNIDKSLEYLQKAQKFALNCQDN